VRQVDKVFGLGRLTGTRVGHHDTDSADLRLRALDGAE
jgi:hypothetical protein